MVSQRTVREADQPFSSAHSDGQSMVEPLSVSARLAQYGGVADAFHSGCKPWQRTAKTFSMIVASLATTLPANVSITGLAPEDGYVEVKK